jgi:hypothetical protein
MVVCAMLDRSMLVHHHLLTDAKNDLRGLEVGEGWAGRQSWVVLLLASMAWGS